MVLGLPEREDTMVCHTDPPSGRKELGGQLLEVLGADSPQLSAPHLDSFNWRKRPHPRSCSRSRWPSSKGWLSRGSKGSDLSYQPKTASPWSPHSAEVWSYCLFHGCSLLNPLRANSISESGSPGTQWMIPDFLHDHMRCPSGGMRACSSRLRSFPLLLPGAYLPWVLEVLSSNLNFFSSLGL